MSNVYKQLNCFDGIAGAAFGGSGGSSSSKKKKKKNNEQVYIGGHVGYVSNTPTSQDRNDQGAILNKSRDKVTPPDCATENKVAYFAGAVAIPIGLMSTGVGTAVGVVGFAAGTKSVLECDF